MQRRGWAARHWGVLSAITAAAVAVCGGTAQAATVQVGSSLTGSFGPILFGDVLTLTQTTLNEPGANLTSPVDGTVVDYRLATPKGTLQLQVLHPTGTGAVASTASSTATEFSIPSGLSGPIATNMPIKKGDMIGLKNSSASGEALGAINNGSTSSYWVPPLSDGAAARFPSGTFAPYEFGIGATVRYCRVPSLKGKTPKAARAALTARDCTVGKVKKTKKVRKKKTVLVQSVAPGTSISDTAPVNLKVTRKS
jgi:PASTA domain